MNDTKYNYLLIAVTFSFLLGVHKGNIALWKHGNPEPVEIYPVQSMMLPISDQQALEAGIPIKNVDELTRLLEDYLS